MAFLGKVGKMLGLGSTKQVLGSVAGPLLDFGMGLVQNNQQSNAAKDAGYANADLQREFAQNSISWKIDDAARRGIHPLAALGVMPHTASPAFMPGGGSDLPSMGQSIGRSIQAGMDRQQRAQVEAMDALTLEKMSLENELLRANITRVNAASNPPFPGNSAISPLPGQSSPVNLLPNDLVMSDPAAPAKDPGLLNLYSHAATPDGGRFVLPSHDAKNLMEDMGPLSWVWYAKNFFSLKHRPTEAPPPGKVWVFNPLTYTWSAMSNKRRPYRSNPKGAFRINR